MWRGLRGEWGVGVGELVFWGRGGGLLLLEALVLDVRYACMIDFELMD